jgi:hypothetical protein
MSNPNEDIRRDEALKRILSTSPKKHADLKKVPTEKRQRKSASRAERVLEDN